MRDNWYLSFAQQCYNSGPPWDSAFPVLDFPSSPPFSTLSSMEGQATGWNSPS
jgi:hypothetical protein